MKPKKNPDLEVGRNSSLYFAVGLNVMLIFTWVLLEHRTYDKVDTLADVIVMANDFDEDIPITTQKVIPPPPPPPSATPEVITVIEDEIEVEETVLESTETSQEEGIEDYDTVAVEDVEVEEIEEDVEVPFAVVEQVPIFPGCSGNNAELKACFQKKITEHIAKNFKYPENAIDAQQEGKVFVMFQVGKNGIVSNMRSRGPYKSLEKEAERIMKLLPKMEPARQRNIAVKVPYAVPIIFKLETH